MERSVATRQGRLPQALRLAGIRRVEEANRFLREHYIAEFNRRFTAPAARRSASELPRVSIANANQRDKYFCSFGEGRNP
jgi:hypothetical protein